MITGALFKVGDVVRVYERDWVGVVELVQVTTTPPHRGRPTYRVRFTGVTTDGKSFEDVLGVEQFELTPYDGWDVPADRSMETVERWLVS